MIQLRPFDPAKGGNTPGLCLQNTRLGYNIPPLYPNAITAWNKTEQHTNRNIPQGVAVPIYFSYKEDGHIGVNLPNGQFWSDGKTYANLEAYEKNHSPKYLGWGESVNNVKVIGVDTMSRMTRQDVTDVYQVVLGQDPEPEAYAWVNQDSMLLVNALRNQANQARATANQTIIDLQKQVDEGSGEFVETKVFIPKPKA